MNDSQKNLSVRLTKISLAVAISLGVIFGIGQFISDAYSQRNNSYTELQEILDTIYPLASKASYELDTQAADELATGLISNIAVYSVILQSDTGQILSTKRQDDEGTFYSKALSWVISDNQYFSRDLYHPFFDHSVGTISIQLNTNDVGRGIIQRAIVNIALGVLRNIALAVVLLFFFRNILTSPLVAISKNLEKIDSKKSNSKLVELPDAHRHDEIGKIVLSINSLLVRESETYEQLRQSQKMEAFGQLTRGVAHEFNNTLAIVLGYIELVQERVASDETSVKYLEMALNGVNLGTEVVKKLLIYSRVDSGEDKVSSVNDIISEMADLLTSSIPVSIDMDVQLAKDVWPIKTNASDLQDALLNLCLNARDAMPDGGKLTVMTTNKILDEDFILLNPQSRIGEYVLISVSDTGTGMTKEIRDKSVEPFFTTKQKDKGTGLGLSMVYGFVHRSGGYLKVHSELGEGSTFQIYLPRSKEVEPTEAAASQREPLPRGHETILVVDDEKSLIFIATANLEALGYKTLSAENAERALQLLEKNKDIDLLFSDIVLPGGGDGYHLALRSHRDHPNLKILLTSVFAKKSREYLGGQGQYLSKLTSNILPKPYNRSELAKAIRAALDEA